MGENDFRERAKMLRARADDLKTRNMLDQARLAPDLAADFADFLGELAARAELLVNVIGEATAP